MENRTKSTLSAATASRTKRVYLWAGPDNCDDDAAFAARLPRELRSLWYSWMPTEHSVIHVWSCAIKAGGRTPSVADGCTTTGAMRPDALERDGVGSAAAGFEASIAAGRPSLASRTPRLSPALAAAAATRGALLATWLHCWELLSGSGTRLSRLDVRAGLIWSEASAMAADWRCGFNVYDIFSF